MQDIQSSGNVIQEKNIYNHLCLICSQFTKKSGKQKRYPTFTNSKEVITKIKHFAEVLNDSDLLQNLQACEEIYYHRSCRTNLQKKYEQKLESKNKNRTWYENREVHKEAFESLVIFLKEEVIQKEKILYVTDVLIQYNLILLELSNLSEDAFKNYTAQHLEEKILDFFKDQISIKVLKTSLKKKIIFKIGLNFEKLLTESVYQEMDDMSKIKSVAYDIRNSIKSMETNPLTEQLRSEDVIKGECVIPKKLYHFISSIINGPDPRKPNSQDDVKIKSLCSDLIHAVSRGRIKPSKNLMLGLTIKSLTGSKKILTGVEIKKI